jgi:enamine deaminase RidA (YjgF/YER057c/UK114 family)
LLSHDASIRGSSFALRVAFAGGRDAATAPALAVNVPWLAGEATEAIFSDVTPAAAVQGVQLYHCGGLLLGHAHEPFVPQALATRTEALYRRVLSACGNRHLYRIWNYVPQINTLTDGFENYRAFCQGRAQGFEAGLGGKFEPRLPSASAVGSRGDRMDVVFIAGETPPRHVENPEQVPAYDYPPEHGPRAPSFARATVARDGDRRFTFISGTSAIKGHQTVAPGALEAQLDCTLDNLRLISRASGLDDNLAGSREARRHFKVYLRQPRDLAVTRARLERSLLQAADTVTYLHAEICRRSLNVEIEATVIE